MFYVYAFLFWLKCKTRKGNRLGSVNMTVTLPYGFLPRRAQVEIFESDLYPHYNHFPKRGVRNKVYIDSHTQNAWCWVGDEYKRIQIPIDVIQKLDPIVDHVFIYQSRSDFPTYGRIGNFYFDNADACIWQCIGDGYVEVKGHAAFDAMGHIKQKNDWKPGQGELFIRPLGSPRSASKTLFSDALLREHLSETAKNIPSVQSFKAFNDERVSNAD